MTRFGIIGCGSAAVPVCEAIAASDLTSLAMVHDINDALARDLGERYGVPHTTRLQDLLGSPDVDAVYIAVPHHLLAALARQALEANKHALVEKPLALTPGEVDDLIALAEAKRRALGVFYEMRYASGFALARQMVQGGAIGEVRGVQVSILIDKPQSYWHAGYSGRSVNAWRSERARAGGGVTIMNASHFLDALWYVTGLELVRVQGEIGSLFAAVEVEDTAAAALTLSNGTRGTLFAGAHIAGARASEGFALFGTRGTLRVPDPYVQGPLEAFLREPWQKLEAGTWHSLTPPKTDVYARAVADFAAAAEQGLPAPINGHDARRVLAAVLALYQSAAEQQPITLPREEVSYA